MSLHPRPALGLLLLLGLLSGCAHRMTATCAAEGGPAWRELTSAHFRVRTDMEPKAASETLLQLERYRRALLLAWGEGFDPPGRVDVIALRHQSELAEFLGKDVSGFAATRSTGPLIVLTGDGGYVLGDSEADLDTSLHELAHYLSRHAMPRQPRWFAEGLATYLETVSVSADGETVTLGKAPVHVFAYARQNYRLRLPQLWEWDRTEPPADEVNRHYASSWLWVHYLFNHQGKRMEDFQTRLARLEEPRAAFAAAFAGLDWEYEQTQVEAYVREGRGSILRTRMPTFAFAPSERALEPAEVHALRVEMLLYAKRTESARELEVKREVEQALRESPTGFAAQLLEARAATHPRRQQELARALVKSHPQQAEAWALLGTVLAEEADAAAEREAALTRGLQLDPDSPVLLNGLGWEYIERGNYARALPLGKRAVELAPWSPEYLDTYAAALAGLKRCDLARVVQGRAVSALSENASAQARQRYEAVLARYEACAAAPAK